MSGPKEEHPTTADGVVEPAAAAEAPLEEVVTSDAPGAGTGPGIEMTAAEALSQATEAAATAKAEPTPEPQSAEAAESMPQPTLESTPAPEAAASDEPETETGPGQEAVATEDDPTESAPEATVETTAQVEPETLPEPTVAADAGGQPDSEQPPQTDGETEDVAGPGAETAEPTEEAETAEPQAEADKPDTAKPAAPLPPERPEMRAVHEAMTNRQPLEGRVIGWNNGGFHLALGDLSAFCPRSEMEVGDLAEPETYLDRTFMFRVLRLQGKGRRIVVSRAAHLRKEKSRQRNELRKQLKPGTVLDGTVASLTDFGAFVDLGGAQGLVHVSEISHRRVEHPSHVLSEGQEVRVKVLKVEQGGRRISLSIRALEPDPWKDLADRFPRGAVVKGTVEKANQIGAFIELAPGLTGLLPARSMSIPRETSPARAYPPGKEVSVQIVSVEPRRQRISLALEGSGLEGSRNDYQDYKRQSRDEGEGDGFNALASAFRRLQGD